MNIDSERADFEEACRKHAQEAGYEADQILARDEYGYFDTHTQSAWWAWQCRASRRLQDGDCDHDAFMWDYYQNAIDAAYRINEKCSNENQNP